jgi:hypothetical protein
VAKHIEFKDRFQNMGAQLVRQVASKTNDAAGDGTTTATVLTRAIFSEGCKAVAAGKGNFSYHERRVLKKLHSILTITYFLFFLFIIIFYFGSRIFIFSCYKSLTSNHRCYSPYSPDEFLLYVDDI